MLFNLKLKLTDHQVVGANFALTHKYTINADEMGLGKTAQAIAVMTVVGGKSLVVCPAYLRDNWASEVEKFSNLTFKIVKKKEDFSVEVDVYICSYNFDYKHTKVDILIYDEAHSLKSVEAKRTMLAHTFVESGRPSHLILLTGTPIKNRVPEWFSLIALCSYCISGSNGLDLSNYFKSPFEFNKFFCYMHKERVVGRNIVRFTGFRNKEKLNKLLEGKFIRRLTKDVIDLPDLLEISVMVDYEKHDIELQTAWDNFNEGKPDVTSGGKAAAALEVAPFTIEYVKGLEDSGQIVIFSDHRNSAQAIHKGLPNSALIMGGMTDTKRSKIIEDFQAGKLKYLIGTIGAMSTGVNLQNANDLIFNDHSWVPGDNEQAKKRIHRMGQTKKCRIHHIFGSKVCAYIHKTLESKSKDIKEAVDLL